MPKLPSACAVGAALTAALCSLTAGTAHAAVTTSAITAPADRTVTEYLFDLDNPLGQPPLDAPANQLAISGTSNGTAADTVDIGCQFTFDSTTPSWEALADDVAVAADGTFSASVSKAELPQWTPCAITAIPGDTPDGARATLPLDGFASRTAFRGYVRTSYSGAANRITDLTIERGQAKGTVQYNSAPSCGLEDSTVVTGTVSSARLFYCNNYFYDNFNDARNMVMVDGKRAVLPNDASDKPGAPALTFSRAVDPATGNLTITERDEVARCDVPADPMAVDQCPSYSPTGVVLERRITQDHEGQQITIADAWTSTDGAAHRLDLIVEDDFNGDDPTFRATWEGGDFAERDEDDAFGAIPAGAPGTIEIDADKTAPDTSTRYPQAAVTYASQPGAFAFASNDDYYVRYLKTIPAGGKADIVTVYSQAVTRGAVDALVAEATAKYTPAPTPPAAPQTIVVPGPSPAPRTITVPTPQCVVPKLVGLTPAKAKAALTRARCKLGKTTKRTTRVKKRIGRVTSASKQVGGGWKVGTKVNLVVGKKAAAKRR